MSLNMRGLWIVVVALLLVVSLVVGVRYRSSMAGARVRLAAVPSQVYHSTFGDIEYCLAGQGPTILISHGITGGVDQGMGLARTYVGEGYRFLFVSRFGYLKSDMPADPSAKLQAAAYAELLNYLGIDRTYILGNSAGATAAYHFAHDYPERCSGLILVSAAVPGDDKGSPPEPVIRAVFGSDFLYWSTVKLARSMLLGMFVPKPIWSALSPAERAGLANDILLSGLPISQRTDGVLFDMFTSNPSVNKDVDFAGIKAPTLIIHAIDDPAPPIAGARRIAALIPNAQLLAFENGGHLLLGHDAEIRQAVSGFLDNQQNR